ncbi:hypothetical protein [Alsobacter soli]|nr:hypothetical protein [Alsobacter soli]
MTATALASMLRKSLVGLTAAVALGGAAVASASPASADGWGRHYHGYHGYYGYRHGWGGGAVAAGLAGGLALGALAAAAAQPTYVAGDCYVVRERVLTDYGWRRIRRTVCE